MVSQGRNFTLSGLDAPLKIICPLAAVALVPCFLPVSVFFSFLASLPSPVKSALAIFVHGLDWSTVGRVLDRPAQYVENL